MGEKKSIQFMAGVRDPDPDPFQAEAIKSTTYNDLGEDKPRKNADIRSLFWLMNEQISKF